MPLLHLVIILVVIGVILWAVNTFIPMEARMKQILNVVVIIAVVFYLLMLFLNETGVGAGPTIGLIG